MTLKVSLIVTTYNWPEALRAVLNSVTMQSELPYEVIVADDGSRVETTEMIAEIQKSFPCPLHPRIMVIRVRNFATRQLRSARETTWCS
jgi:glycosyltransferase involved in cell wall biosynthesis